MVTISHRPIRLWGDVSYPIMSGRWQGDSFNVNGVVGTGFVPADQVLVTCWHCVRATKDGVDFGLGLRPSASEGQARVEKIAKLHDIAQDPRGLDLATARVGLESSALYNLSPEKAVAGFDVWSAGFPMPRRTLLASGQHQTDLTPRHLQGYVVREFPNLDHPGYPTQPTYELDMLAPGGLSGAPLMVRSLAPVGLRLVGVVYGSHDNFTVAEEMETSDAGRLEVRRYVSFAWAHAWESVAGLVGPATREKQLRDLMRDSPDFG